MQRTMWSRPFERRGHDHRQVAQRAVGGQLLEHLEAVHLGHLHVEQQQVERLARAASRARRGRSRRRRRVWPCSSRLRVSSRRLTLLSSATSRRAGPWRRSAIAQLRQRGGGARVLRVERVERIGLAPRVETAELELARQRAERERAEGVGVRLERMRGAAERARPRRRPARARSSASIVGASSRKVSTSSLDEVGAGAGLQLGEGRGVDDRRGSCQRSLRAARRCSASTSRSTRIGLVR